MAEKNVIPLPDNPAVQELFSLMKENGKDTAGLASLLAYVKQMEDFVKSAESQLADMKAQISEMKEIQKHPIKMVLNRTSQSLDSKVHGVKAHIGKIRDGIVEACKNALTAFKENGVTALDKLAGFFHIKQGIEAVQRDAGSGIERCNMTVEKIETFSREYHAAGLHAKNMLRALMGKEPLESAKETGKLAKAMCAPYKVERKCLGSIRDTADKALVKLDELGKNAGEIRQERQERKNPGIDGHIASFEEKARKQNREKSGGVVENEHKPQAESVMP